MKSLSLHHPEIGDIIEFQNTGAYCMYEGISLFLSRDLPKIYLYDKQEGLTLMRDTFETNVLNYKSIGGRIEMEKLLEILNEVSPDVDYENCTTLN